MSAAHAQGAAEAGPAPPLDPPAKGIVVTATRPSSETAVDRKVYKVTGDLQSTTGSAADVLNEVPSVDVDPDGALTLRGDPNVTILVDGKPSAAFTGAAAGLSLLQFPASDIERVEVMTNPPAQFKAAGSAGVINIITRKNRRTGLSGTLRASGGEFGRLVVGGDGNYNLSKLKLTFGAGIRRDIRRRLTTDNRIEVDPATGVPTRSAETIDERFHRITPNIKVGADLEITTSQSLGASANYAYLTGH